jgi:WhiB family redox-sensing transcriptional regulator
VADYRDAISGPADVPELAPAPAGRPGEGSPARDAGAVVPAQDACRRLIARVGAGAGATSWMAHGACHRSDPELFFPIAAAGTAAEQIQTIYAKTVCGRCEVGKECLSYALRTMPDGIWGGTTREERIGLRARPAARSPRQAVTDASRTATPGRPGANRTSGPHPPARTSIKGRPGMDIGKDHVLQLLRSQGKNDQASQAGSEPPDKIDIDNAQHAALLSKYEIDPGSLIWTLGGLGKPL